MSKTTLFSIIGGIILVLVAALAFMGQKGCTNSSHSTPPVTYRFYRGKLLYENNNLVLRSAISLTVEISPLEDSNNTHIHFLLPSGIELVQGDLDWRGDISGNQVVRHSIKVRIIEQGKWTLQALIKGTTPNGNSILEVYPLYISASEAKIEVNSLPIY